jgi:hypothetical protein
MSEPMVLTPRAAIGLLRMVVHDKGADYVYPRVARGLPCVNFTDDGPSCIVGHVLERIGVTADDAKILGINGEISASESCGRLEQAEFRWRFASETLDILEVAQMSQDSGGTWGHALARAEEALARLEASDEPAEVSDDLC